MNCGNNKKQGFLPVTGVASTYFHPRCTSSVPKTMLTGFTCDYKNGTRVVVLNWFYIGLVLRKESL